jgi:hypothetical protein
MHTIGLSNVLHCRIQQLRKDADAGNTPCTDLTPSPVRAGLLLLLVSPVQSPFGNPKISLWTSVYFPPLITDISCPTSFTLSAVGRRATSSVMTGQIASLHPSSDRSVHGLTAWARFCPVRTHSGRSTAVIGHTDPSCRLPNVT